MLIETPDWEVFSGGGGDQERVGRDGDWKGLGIGNHGLCSLDLFHSFQLGRANP